METASEQQSNVMTVDLTPTWGEIGNVYARMAESGERAVVRELRGELARAFAFAEAFKTVHAALPVELRQLADKAVNDELRKQGFIANGGGG